MIRARVAGVLACLAGLLPGLAQGQAAACAEPVREWVEAASRAIDVPAEPVSCPPGMARVRLRPRAAPPIDVEVAEPPGPAFRTAGRLRTSPVVETNDYGALPAEQRAAYESLVAWLEANQERVVLHAPAPGHQAVGGEPGPERARFAQVGPWLVLAALLLLALGVWRHRPGAVEWRPFLAVVALAGALRWAFGLWGPHHVNGQGPLWIRGALGDLDLLSGYGPGYAELLGPVARAFPGAPAVAIFAANVVLGSLSCGLLFAVARAAELERNRALFAALLLAFAPPAVRFAASEAYFTPIGALLLTATLALLLATRSLHRGRRAAAAALLVAAGLLAAQAARVHPVAWIGIALLPLSALLPRAPRGVIGRVVPVVLGGVAVGAIIWLVSGGWLAVVLSAIADGEGRPGFAESILRGTYAHEVVPAVALSAAAFYLARPRAPVLLGALHVLVALATYRVYGQSFAWSASYATLYLPMIAVGLAAVLPRALGAIPAAALPAVMAGAVLLVAGASLTEPTTEQLEHAFLGRELRQLEPGCRLAYLERADERLVMPPTWAHPGGEPPLRVREPGDLAAAASRSCVHWLHTSICSSREARDRCAAIERSVPLEPVAHTRLPARPSYDGLPYDEARVEVAIHRVARAP